MPPARRSWATEKDAILADITGNRISELWLRDGRELDALWDVLHYCVDLRVLNVAGAHGTFPALVAV